MSDRGYILIRTIEPQVSMAEQNGMNEVWMTTGFVREIIDVLRAQEADIAALKNAYKELAEKGDVVIRCKDCKYYDTLSEQRKR